MPTTPTEKETEIMRVSQAIYSYDDQLLLELIGIFEEFDTSKALKEGRLRPQDSPAWFRAGGLIMKAAIREHLRGKTFDTKEDVLSDEFIQIMFLVGLRQISDYNHGKRVITKIETKP